MYRHGEQMPCISVIRLKAHHIGKYSDLHNTWKFLFNFFVSINCIGIFIGGVFTVLDRKNNCKMILPAPFSSYTCHCECGIILFNNLALLSECE